jgi:hypothetical protein
MGGTRRRGIGRASAYLPKSFSRNESNRSRYLITLLTSPTGR